MDSFPTVKNKKKTNKMKLYVYATPKSRKTSEKNVRRPKRAKEKKEIMEVLHNLHKILLTIYMKWLSIKTFMNVLILKNFMQIVL